MQSLRPPNCQLSVVERPHLVLQRWVWQHGWTLVVVEAIMRAVSLVAALSRQLLGVVLPVFSFLGGRLTASGRLEVAVRGGGAVLLWLLVKA